MNEGYQWCEECKIYYDEELYSTCPLCYMKMAAHKIEFISKVERKDSPLPCLVDVVLAVIVISIIIYIFLR